MENCGIMKNRSAFQRRNLHITIKNNGLQNQSVLYRKDAKGTETVFLDPNTFSKDGTTSLGGLDFSKDGSKVAYAISEGGSD
jgi:prolyl oligopeptidase